MFLGKEGQERRREGRKERKKRRKKEETALISVSGAEWESDWSLAPPHLLQKQNCILSGKCKKFNFPLRKANYLADCHFNQQASLR